MAENDNLPERASAAETPEKIEQNATPETSLEASASAETSAPAIANEPAVEPAPASASVASKHPAHMASAATESATNAVTGNAASTTSADVVDAAFEPMEPGSEGQAPAGGQAADAIIKAARSTAEAGSRSINEGISALREVSAAKHAHATSREQLEDLETELARKTEALAHRREVEQNYDEIIRVQSAEVSDAAAKLAEAQTLEAQLLGEQAARAGELSRLKEQNEERLSPYHKLMDEAKAALVAAQGAQAQAKRALKTAQSQAESSSRSSDSRAAAANRAVESAQAKLQRLQDQQAEMRRAGKASEKDLADISGKVTTALAQLERARAEVQNAQAEGSQAAEIAQTHLYTQRTSLEQAESDLAAAKAAEQQRREEYERLRREADEGEKALEQQVSELEGKLAEARHSQELALGRSDAAKAAIEEAEQIHATPGDTERLAQEVLELEGNSRSQRIEVERLSRELHQTRERTQRQRIIFFVLVAAAALVLILILRLVLGA